MPRRRHNKTFVEKIACFFGPRFKHHFGMIVSLCPPVWLLFFIQRIVYRFPRQVVKLHKVAGNRHSKRPHPHAAAE